MRRPTTIGIIGVDFGYKPAISVAIPKRPRTQLEAESVKVCPSCVEPNPASAPTTLTISGSVSGEHTSGEMCGAADFSFTATLTPKDFDLTCVCWGDDICHLCIRATGAVEFTCPECEESPTELRVEAELCYDPDADEWRLSLNASFAPNELCQRSLGSAGGDGLISADPLGSDPTGSHNYAFTDPNDARIDWDITVEIT